MTQQPQTRALVRTGAPALEPLTLAEAKLYLRVDGTAEDTLITDLIAAVRQQAEEFLKCSLITQTWTLMLDHYAPAYTPLPRGPVQSVTEVKVVARDDTETVFNSSHYTLTASKEQLCFDAAPLGHRVEITYVAGYGDSAADIPEALQQGMLAHLAALYDGRGAHDVPGKSLRFYAPYRRIEL